MRLQRLTPMLWVKDINATALYYTNILGFVVDEMNEEWGWCHLSKDEVAIMFSVPNMHTPFTESNATASFYIYTEDVDECWEQLKHKADVFYPIESFEYGMREFAIKDINGYILQFGKEIN